MVVKETDEDAAKAWFKRIGNMREGCADAIGALKCDGDLTQTLRPAKTTDLIWTLLSFLTWQYLTRDSGRSQDAYARHLNSLTCQALAA